MPGLSKREQESTLPMVQTNLYPERAKSPKKLPKPRKPKVAKNPY